MTFVCLVVNLLRVHGIRHSLALNRGKILTNLIALQVACTIQFAQAMLYNYLCFENW
jgi:hypothetical protein